MISHVTSVVLSYGSLDNLAKLANVLSVVAIMIAWATYVRTNRKERRSHANMMFREYLRLDFEYHMTRDGRDDDEALRRLRAYKMWVLDEINEWIDGENERFIFSQSKKDARDRLVVNWKETIKFHLHRHSNEKYWEAFLVGSRCYSDRFVKFATEWHIDSKKHINDELKLEPKDKCKYCKLMKSPDDGLPGAKEQLPRTKKPRAKRQAVAAT